MESVPNNDGSNKILEADSGASARATNILRKVKEGLDIDKIIKGLEPELQAEIKNKQELKQGQKANNRTIEENSLEDRD